MCAALRVQLSERVARSRPHLSVGRCVASLAAAVVAVVGTQARVFQGAVGAGGGSATAAVGVAETLTVLLMDL